MISSKYNQLYIYNIEKWLQSGYASNYHIDNTNFDDIEKLIDAIFCQQILVVNAIEINESDRTNLIFFDNYIIKTFIDYKSICQDILTIRKIDFTSIYTNIIDVNTKEEADKALELLRKLKY